MEGDNQQYTIQELETKAGLFEFPEQTLPLLFPLQRLNVFVPSNRGVQSNVPPDGCCLPPSLQLEEKGTFSFQSRGECQRRESKGATVKSKPFVTCLPTTFQSCLLPLYSIWSEHTLTYTRSRHQSSHLGLENIMLHQNHIFTSLHTTLIMLMEHRLPR